MFKIIRYFPISKKVFISVYDNFSIQDLFFENISIETLSTI